MKEIIGILAVVLFLQAVAAQEGKELYGDDVYWKSERMAKGAAE